MGGLFPTKITSDFSVIFPIHLFSPDCSATFHVFSPSTRNVKPLMAGLPNKRDSRTGYIDEESPCRRCQTKINLFSFPSDRDKDVIRARGRLLPSQKQTKI